jgi:hypothetical protein
MAGRPYVQAGIGEVPVRMISSILADEKSAFQLANLVMARWGDDSAWESPTVIVRHQLLSPAERADVAALEPGDELVTGGMGAQPGIGGAGRWRVEGWQETWDRGDGSGDILRVQQFAVSDALRWRTDPGQLTRTAVQLLTPGPYVYPVNALTIRYDVVPADNQPPERPMDGPVEIWIDDYRAATSMFKGKPVTVVLSGQINRGSHTLRVDYGGPWGVWADSSATVDFTVGGLPVTPVLSISPAGPVGLAPVLTVRVPGLAAGDILGFYVDLAEMDAPEVWTFTGLFAYTDGPLQLPAYNRPVLLRIRWWSGSESYEVADSNVVAFGYSWLTVAVNYPSWRTLADTRPTWRDVARGG